ALGEQTRQHGAEWALEVEEADATHTEGVVAAAGEAADDVRGVEDGGGVGGRFAAGETQGERPRILAGPGWRRQEAGEERSVGREGEVPRRVPLLPAVRQQPGQERRPPPAEAIDGHIIAKCVERQQQYVVAADE